MEEIINIINDINYDEMSCGCGLEDNKITNRYEAMRYGWDLAYDKPRTFNNLSALRLCI